MTSKKINKKHIISKLVEVPSAGRRSFWPKEMVLLNKLESKYSLEFLEALSLDKKYDSLAVLFSDSFSKTLNKRFKDFNYKPKSYSEFSCDVSENKFSEDKVIDNKPKTVKDFLNE